MKEYTVETENAGRILSNKMESSGFEFSFTKLPFVVMLLLLRHEEERRRREEEMMRHREQEDMRRQPDGFKPNYHENVSNELKNTLYKYVKKH